MVKTMRVLPFVFAFAAMLIFLLAWFTAFPNAYQGDAGMYFVFSYVLAAAASAWVSFRLLLRFSRHRTHLGPKAFGISLGFANLLTIALVFSLATFATESFSSKLLQWGGLYFYFGWIIVYGIPFALVLGLIFGAVLARVSRDHLPPPHICSTPE